MSAAVLVRYSKKGEAGFDHKYYMGTHAGLAVEQLKGLVERVMTYPYPQEHAYHRDTYLLIRDGVDPNMLLKSAELGKVVADVPNFYSGDPDVSVLNDVAVVDL